MMGIEWEIPRGLRSFFWVLVSSRSGNNKKKSGVTQVIMGNGKRKSVYKNDLMQHGECVLHKVVILFTFERFSEYLSLPLFGVQRMPRFPKNNGCHRANSNILKRAKSLILSHLLFFQAARPFFFLVLSFSLSIFQSFGQRSLAG